MFRVQFTDRHFRRLFPLPTVVFIAIMLFFPIIYTAYISLTNWDLQTTNQQKFIGLENYISAFQDGKLLNALLRTLYFSSIAVSIETALGVAIALFLYAERSKAASLLLLLPMVATPVSIAMVWLLIYEHNGLANALLKIFCFPPLEWIANRSMVMNSLILVDIWQWTPMISLVVLAGLIALPREPYEAAKIDGANAWTCFWNITFPLLSPTILIAMLLRAIDAIKTFDIIYVMTGGGPNFASETLNIYIYQEAFVHYHFAYASTLLILFFILILGLVLLISFVRNIFVQQTWGGR